MSKVVRITETKESSVLSKAQKTFNKLIKQIESKRKLLAEWKTTIPECQSKYAREFVPRMELLNQHKKEMVELLDKLHSGKGLAKGEKEKVSDIICRMSQDLIANFGCADLKEVYNRHSNSDFDAEAEKEKEMLKSMAEGFFGIDLGDDFEMGSPEEMLKAFGKSFDEEFAKKTKRKKSAATLAKEAKLQEETQKMSKSVREIFLKLASALHPDLEQDVSERKRKTELMQRANVLYEKNDLLGLLELQLEIEQIDQALISTISEEKLIYHNKVLKKQYDELQCEIAGIEMGFGMHFRSFVSVNLSPKKVLYGLERDIDELQCNIEGIKNDLEKFQNVHYVKACLKSVPKKSKFFRQDEGVFFRVA